MKGCNKLEFHEPVHGQKMPGWRWWHEEKGHYWAEMDDATFLQNPCGTHIGSWILLCPECQIRNGVKW